MRIMLTSIALSGIVLTGTAQAAITSDFENLSLAANSYWSGQTSPAVPLYQANPGSFSSGLATFSNEMTDWGGATSWSGWAYSNMTDNVTPGFDNQYSVYSGTAHSGNNFGVAYVAGDDAKINFSGDVQVNGFYLTNTTYTALAILYGDSFSKKFGGSNGNDADWLKLSVSGLNAGVATSTVDFYLADYRSANNSLDYIVKGWEWLDLSSLGSVDSLKFAMSSSDTGAYGMNTPAYFAMDDLTVTAVPVPPALWLMGGGLLIFQRMAGGNTRKKHRSFEMASV